MTALIYWMWSTTSPPPTSMLGADMATLNVQRRMTENFIAADPQTIVLTPQTISVASSGARLLTPGPPKIAQVFKLIFMSTINNQRVTFTIDGIERIITYTLLGTYDSDMDVWDTWTEPDGSICTIVAMSEGFGYEKKGMVERHLPVT